MSVLFFCQSVSLMLEKGADITAKDKYDWTPQQFAEINDHTEVLELLHGTGSGNVFANEFVGPPCTARR